jgi:heme oxygenase
MLGHLAQQTRQLHGAADGDRLAVMEKPTHDRYRTCLAQIYCFEAPIEAACISTEGIPRTIVRTHLKTARLAADLEALGFAARDAIPIASPGFAGFDRAVDALAWLWVLHRNTLLHGLIYRYLLGKLPATMHTAGSYLCAFEGQAGALLRELGNALDDATKRASTSERAVVAAKDAFRMQRQWYSCDLASPDRQPLPRTFTPRAA